MGNLLRLCFLCTVCLVSVFNLSAQKTSEAEVGVQAKLIDAQNLLLIDDVKGAEAIYLSILNEEDNSTASFKLAELYFLDGKYDVALTYAKKALEWKISEPWIYILLADIQARTGHYNESTTTIKRLVDLEPQEWKYWEIYANMLEASGAKSKDILNALDEQIKWQGETEEVLEKKVNLYIEDRDFESAMQTNKQWLALNGDSEKALEYLGSLYLVNGQEDQALSTYRRLLEVNSLNEEALRNISALQMEAVAVDDAKDQLRIPINGILNNTGLSADEKVKHLLPFVQLYAQSKDSTLGSLLLGASEILSESSPNSGVVSAFRADLLSIGGDTRAAVNSYKLAVESEQSNFLLWQQLLTGLSELGEYSELQTYADTALEYFPAVLQFQYLKGLALHKLGHNEEAISTLNNLLILAPDDDENAVKAKELLNQLNN